MLVWFFDGSCLCDKTSSLSKVKPKTQTILGKSYICYACHVIRFEYGPPHNLACVCVVSHDAQCCFIRPYMLIVQIWGTFQINTLHIYRYALEHSVVLHLWMCKRWNSFDYRTKVKQAKIKCPILKKYSSALMFVIFCYLK